jgi:hypothetical protein
VKCFAFLEDEKKSKGLYYLAWRHVRKVLKVLGILPNGKKMAGQLPVQGNDQLL